MKSTRKQHRIPVTDRRKTTPSRLATQTGSALIAVLVVTFIVGVITATMFNISDQAHNASAANIQRNRAFQSIDAALMVAEEELANLNAASRLYSDTDASEGIYSFDSRGEKWWNTAALTAAKELEADAVLGVVSPPKYAFEEIGNYVYDGGTGVVNLDVGAAAYGNTTSGGREVILYSVEAYGNGSFDSVKAAAESIVVFTH